MSPDDTYLHILCIMCVHARPYTCQCFLVSFLLIVPIIPLMTCYGCGLLTVVLLYEKAPGLIWGYHYDNFPVFTYVSDRFSRF